VLIERGVIPDFREPNLIRLGLSPLSTSYEELSAAVEILVEVAVEEPDEKKYGNAPRFP
jgi:kynureninase